MRFEVPQFVDIEDKIFGPLTFKQFIYIAGGVGVSVVAWVLLPKLIAIPIIAVAMAAGLALAFYKFNGKPFVFVIEAALRYITGAKLYIWKKEVRPVTSQTPVETGEAGLSVPRLSDSKLRDLAWSLDVHDSIYEQTTDNN